MDKKNLLIGIVLLVAAFGLMQYTGSRNTPRQQPPPPAQQSAPAGAPGSAVPPSAPGVQSNATFAPVASAYEDARYVTLSNDYIQARFTNFGGALEDIAFKKYAAEKSSDEPFVFNGSHADPIFAFTTDAFTSKKLDRHVSYELVSQSATEVVYRTVFENRIEVLRRYTIVPTGAPEAAGDPYIIRHELTLRNLTGEAVPMPAFSFNIGTASPVNERDNGMYLTSGYNNGEKSKFIERSKLAGGSGFLGFGASAPVPYVSSPEQIVWASVSNQFFTGLLTPDQPGRGMITRRIELPPLRGMTTPAVGLTVSAAFDVPALAPNAETTLGFNYYGGPKEYTRIRSFSKVSKKNEDEVLQFSSGFYRTIMLSGFFSPIMNRLMVFMHSFVGQWGIAIIMMTLMLKFVTLPFTLSASRSAKRMQKVQPEMQAIREKFKDNPQKLNQATMELFKKHRVNPLGGCLPIFITMPLFVAFFFMLQSTAELRFQSFLWASDLSAPDTIARLPWLNFPINIMPILMGATMMIQMRLTPSPSVDNMQVKIMKFMPLMFIVFFYNFSCALALYSTVNGLFTICQQLVVNRMKDKEPAPAPAPAAKGKRPMKNVTPPKKK
ncbi:YidC/Oxa1 family membrane protein insertase [Ereboglobus sp. PH5-10]|uniref:membrane protein insertase YidC n=1 Tax=Ereboglobus sp. PH5-10 TaxID=2940629 RepID=UPI002406076B|nr:membrane protein insertase YidC [Ereboglobus sp. PH5-10]MDF9826717.1 YidC/Oxa1 family membrane protein insertase [Ereboglobus sp. PH5-10]